MSRCGSSTGLAPDLSVKYPANLRARALSRGDNLTYDTVHVAVLPNVRWLARFTEPTEKQVDRVFERMLRDNPA